MQGIMSNLMRNSEPLAMEMMAIVYDDDVSGSPPHFFIATYQSGYILAQILFKQSYAQFGGYANHVNRLSLLV